jgi:hypothetical protein
MLLMHLVVLVLVIFVLIQIVPAYIELFAKEDVELPAMTIQLMNLSSFFVRYFFIVVLLGVIADAAIVVLLEFVVKKCRWLLSVYSQALLFAVIIFLIWVSIALCLPIVGRRPIPVADRRPPREVTVPIFAFGANMLDRVHEAPRSEHQPSCRYAQADLRKCRNNYTSRNISTAAFLPHAPITPPPGWEAAPHM